jgi:hypothetical protein
MPARYTYSVSMTVPGHECLPRANEVGEVHEVDEVHEVFADIWTREVYEVYEVHEGEEVSEAWEGVEVYEVSEVGEVGDLVTMTLERRYLYRRKRGSKIYGTISLHRSKDGQLWQQAIGGEYGPSDNVIIESF